MLGAVPPPRAAVGAVSAADALRMQRARQVIHSERDKLLKRADKRTDLSRFLPSDGKDRARAILLTGCLAIVAMTPYVLMILLWFFVFHYSFAQTLVACSVLVLVGALFCAASSKRVLSKERVWMWWFGVVWMQATVVGLILGFFLYFRGLAYYWKYEEMRTYTNVGASQASESFGDGGMFLFSEDTRLDAVRAVGYKSRWTGMTYCVAPLVDGAMNQASDIHYWAVGDNCCTPRAEFHCDDAQDFSARSALRVLQPEDVVSPFMRWAVTGSSFSSYQKAVALQEATYATKAALRPTFVRWSRDPVTLKDSSYTTPRDICFKFSICYLVLVVTGVYFIAWKIIPRQRAQAVVRET